MLTMVFVTLMVEVTKLNRLVNDTFSSLNWLPCWSVDLDNLIVQVQGYSIGYFNKI